MNKSGIKLIATPLSHFARKARILLDLYKIPYEFQNIVGNIALTKTPGEVGDNPLMMKAPILQHGPVWMIESDHISSYIVDQFDPKDMYNVNSKQIFDLNTRAIINGAMTEQLKVIVAGRHNVPTEKYEYFSKSRDAVNNSLLWLENNHSKFTPNQPTYREFHLTCFLDHLAYYDFVPQLTTKFPRINEVVSKVSENPIIKQTAPLTMVPK